MAQCRVFAGLNVDFSFTQQPKNVVLEINKEILHKHRTGLAFLFRNQDINRLKVNSIVKQI